MNELDIEAKIENLDKVLAFVDEQLTKTECSKKTRYEIDIAVEEIFVNICHYAYSPDVGRGVIRVEMRDSKVVLTFIDRGHPYDPLSRDDPDTSLGAEERKPGGLGIFMVKKSMEDVTYEYKEGRNILRFKKTV